MFRKVDIALALLAAHLCASCTFSDQSGASLEGIPEDSPPEVQQALATQPQDRSGEQRSHIEEWCMASAPGLDPATEDPIELPEPASPGAENSDEPLAAAPELQNQALSWSLQQCEDKYFLDAYKPVDKDYAKQVYAQRKELSECLTTMQLPVPEAPSEGDFVDQFISSASERVDIQVWNPHDALGGDAPAEVVADATRQCNVAKPEQ